MGKKKTFEEVKKLFDARGYQLLETEYVNVFYLMRYRCPNHPERTTKISTSKLLQGNGCPYCARKAKYTIEEVSQIFFEHGYELLETKYKDNVTPLRFRCPKHPDKELKMSLSNLFKGQKCLWCSGKVRYTYKEVKSIFLEHGYELLESSYKNSTTKMRYRCPKHPDKNLKISFTTLKNQGAGCPYCAKTVTHTYAEVVENFRKKGYKLVSKKYIKAALKLEYVCNKHPNNIQQITYNNLLRGHGCAYCAGNIKHTYEKVKNFFVEKGYELITKKYINSHTPMQYICKKHPSHIQKISVDSLQSGRGCQDCWGGRNSRLSKKIEKKLIKNNIVFRKEHRFPDCRLELPLAFDFYLPQHNVCIEIDGQQHFKPVAFGGISEERAKKEFELTVKRDKIKDDYCRDKKITLIRIPYFKAEKAKEILGKLVFMVP